ncbi:MAG: hypothetical protein JRN39_04440 [Nitrososphaerota archaeon]|nr:hypothetical protein [Nitrososphaerota archaeon]
MPSLIGRAKGVLLMETDTTDPPSNLRLEDDIFARVDRGEADAVLRFWKDDECLVRGRAKSVRYGWYAEEAAARLSVPVYERSTGGGVVYHGPGNLNWSFFARVDGRLLSPSRVFADGSWTIIEALRRLGFPASLAPPNRIDVDGKKVSGMAARSTIHALLVHGTLLIDADIGKIDELCIPPPGCPPVSNLSAWRKVDDREVVAAARRVLEEAGLRVSEAERW